MTELVQWVRTWWELLVRYRRVKAFFTRIELTVAASNAIRSIDFNRMGGISGVYA